MAFGLALATLGAVHGHGAGLQSSRAGGLSLLRATAVSMEAPVTAPPESMTAIAERVFLSDLRPIILFDGICNLCNGGVNFMLDWDRPDDIRGVFRFAALQSDVGKGLLMRSGRAPDDISSIVVTFRDRPALVKSDAILYIGSKVGGGTPLEPAFPIASKLASTLVPKPVRDAVYDQISLNRYNIFGESSQCRLSDERFEERFVSGLLDKWTGEDGVTT
eukprot:CAMPEP_0185184668 /NCGR_PEP_ID=MMETSP1140-20130426/2711_1 /TAXON_ID=298111 /ORGANISM="Pavlova sp., Strain CCMP459" /LENGTH=218 /DNA_ID=CAMNT_0027750749 /DNA_START=13 /DNA_END=669 /DNA_ORIENTATION=+